MYKAIEIAKTLRNHFRVEQQEGYLGTLKYLLREAEYLGDAVESAQSNLRIIGPLGLRLREACCGLEEVYYHFCLELLVKQIYLTYARLPMIYQEINKQWSICWKNK